ncbi:MAG: HAMP domain-containing protein [Methylomonas sp.]|nr:HAMP domain-containing protein [Methylomonas sp.]PPD22073.1 MAG: histidine kinase [Methylomonas sp.]PPD26161.1 MAG: histidine kinase [Methylomonas sp.]PPD37876.1 MAG: histidine kinase [Methylomonas sp.]PPD42472.1 MAG: histidine kinase [Methylomonas sp.]
MSLRYQILYRILLSFTVILILGGAMAIWHARHSVAKEVDASIHLALQIISLGIAEVPNVQQIDDLSRFKALRQTRHLNIEVVKANGERLHFVGEDTPIDPQTLPPAWFTRLVKSDYPKVERRIETQDGESVTLVISAQPMDEITEVWEESVAFFASISLLTLLTFLFVNLVFNKSLQSIERIVTTLRIVETGDYSQQLPPFQTTEFDDIANAINHMTAELERTRLENRALTQNSLVIQEDERQRLSQELHDEFGQSLTAIKVMAVTAGHKQPDNQKITQAIAEICDHLMSVVRSMMQQLHPLVLTELGLKATLEDTVNRWSERNPELELRIACSDEVDMLDKTIVIQVFRVIQECLTNVVRHAGAKQVDIAVSLSGDNPARLMLRVRDDGRGCDLSTVTQGFGLRGMKERIKSLDGNVSIQSSPGAGMSIEAWVPVFYE